LFHITVEVYMTITKEAMKHLKSSSGMRSELYNYSASFPHSVCRRRCTFLAERSLNSSLPYLCEAIKQSRSMVRNIGYATPTVVLHPKDIISKLQTAVSSHNV
jgi:hypothetical protein